MLKTIISLVSAKFAIESKIQMQLNKIINDQRGATAVEYALIVGLIAVAIIAAVTLLGGNISTLFNHAACVVKGATWTNNACSA